MSAEDKCGYGENEHFHGCYLSKDTLPHVHRTIQREAEKPLHVRVAEALGWTATNFATEGNLSGWGGTKEPCWVGTNPNNSPFCNDEIPRYDTDWAATGPLVEKYELTVCPTSASEGWYAYHRSSDRRPLAPSRTPLIAICNLILALHAAGKL